LECKNFTLSAFFAQKFHYFLPHNCRPFRIGMAGIDRQVYRAKDQKLGRDVAILRWIRPSLWSPNGRELFYVNGDSIMTVAVEAGPTFTCGKPEKIFQG